MPDKAEYVSDQIADVLRAAGCKYLPLVPGSSFRGLHDSLVNHGGDRDPQIILCTSELVAVACAHAYAKATGEVGYAAIHDLVGLMQASMSVYNAWCDRTPLVVLGGGGPADPARRRPVDWFHSANTQSALVRDYVKWDDDPVTAQATVDALVRGHRIAATDPKGPVYVTIDHALQEEDARPLVLPEAGDFAGRVPTAARTEDVEHAARLLAGARLPVIVAGRVGLEKEATPLLVGLAESLAAGLRDERNLSAVPTEHPLTLNGDTQLLADADVILFVEAHDLNMMREQVGDRDDCTVIDLSDNDLALRSWTHAGHGRPGRALRLPAQGLYGLRQLTDAVSRLIADASASENERRRARREELTDRARGVRDLLAAQRANAQEARPIGAARLVQDLYGVVRDEPWLLTLRNTRSWPEGVWEFAHGGQFLGHSGGGGVGYGPGALLGGALAARDRGQLAVGIIGDGDLLYGPGVLWTASHYNVPMLTVVNNNRSYFNDEEHQRRIARARNRPPENAHVGIRFTEPTVDFAAMADSHGAVGIGPVTSPDDLSEAFAEGLKRVRNGDVVVVDVHTA